MAPAKGARRILVLQEKLPNRAGRRAEGDEHHRETHDKCERGSNQAPSRLFPLDATVRPRFPKASRCTRAPAATRTARETKSDRPRTPQELKFARFTPKLRSERSGSAPPSTTTLVLTLRVKVLRLS